MGKTCLQVKCQIMATVSKNFTVTSSKSYNSFFKGGSHLKMFRYKRVLFGFEFPYKSLNFPLSCADYSCCNLGCELPYLQIFALYR